MWRRRLHPERARCRAVPRAHPALLRAGACRARPARKPRRLNAGPRLMLQIDVGFEPLLGAHTVAELDAEPGSVIGLWPDGRIALLNSAWQQFARQNGGE